MCCALCNKIATNSRAWQHVRRTQRTTKILLEKSPSQLKIRYYYQFLQDLISHCSLQILLSFRQYYRPISIKNQIISNTANIIVEKDSLFQSLVFKYKGGLQFKTTPSIQAHNQVKMVIKITIKTLDSKNYQFEAQDDWIVSQFKDHIKETVNVVPIEQRLIFCGRVLQNDKKLTDYDCNDKVIHLVRRPPPSLDQPSDANSNTNNNTTNMGPPPIDIHNLSDIGNVIVSAMLMGPPGDPDQGYRNLMSFTQAIRSMPNAATPTSESAVIGQCLTHANRLFRTTSNLITECVSRLPRNSPIVSDARFSTPLVSTTSSHTNLQSRNLSQSSANNSALGQPAERSVDDSNVSNQANTSQRSDDAARPLTTDDLGSFGGPRSASGNSTSVPSVQEGGPRELSGSSLDQYLDLLNFAANLQNQIQAVTSRYSELVNMIRRGGSVVSSAMTRPETTNALSDEARALGRFFPRIISHFGALQIALSEFSLDMAAQGGGPVLRRGAGARLNRMNQQPQSNVPPQAGAQRPEGDQYNQPDIDHTIEGSVVITARALDGTPLMSANTNTTNTAPNNNQTPQASATIVMSSGSNQPRVEIPMTIPFTFNPAGLINILTQALNQHLGPEPQNQQQQQSQQSNQGQQPPPPQSRAPNVPLMMDIDIDDSSSSQSDRYQDARDTPADGMASAVHHTHHFSNPSTSLQGASSSGQSTQATPAARFNRNQLAEVLQTHPEWIPVIEADINIMEQQTRATNNVNPPPFSEAYLSSIPKRRRGQTTSHSEDSPR